MILEVRVIPYQSLGSDLVSCIVIDDDGTPGRPFVMDREALIALLFDGGWRDKFDKVEFQKI